jgi:DNA sulfur modification protein DndB
MLLDNYTFTAIRGRQGKYEYFLFQCPLRLIPRLFLFDEVEVPISLRRARSVSIIQAADIAKYLIAEPETYILAPIVATTNKPIAFEPTSNEQDVIGHIKIPITAQIILQDGQHRRLAIQQLLSKTTALENDTIPVMLFPDENLTRSSHLYAILNNKQLKNSRSKRALYEDSDLAALVQQLIDELPLFQGRVELEKTTISNRSTALFTLSAIYQANEALLGVHKNDQIGIEIVDTAQRFWNELSNIIPEWRKIIVQEVSPFYLRQHYVHSHTVMLVALGRAGNELIKQYPDDWPIKLRTLEQIDWSRSNVTLWEGRAMVHGKMSKATDSIKLSTNAIKRVLGLKLTKEEQELENLLTSK